MQFEDCGVGVCNKKTKAFNQCKQACHALVVKCKVVCHIVTTRTLLCSIILKNTVILPLSLVDMPERDIFYIRKIVNRTVKGTPANMS